MGRSMNRHQQEVPCPAKAIFLVQSAVLFAGDSTTVEIVNNGNSNGSCKKLVDDQVSWKSLSFKQIAQKRVMGIPSIVWFFVMIAILACLAGAILQFAVHVPDPDNLNSTERIFIGDKTHEFIPRARWGALKPNSSIPIIEPTPYIVISHTAGSFCYQEHDCIRIVSNIQKYHLSKNYADISYNFLVGGDGNIYEGRGWGIRSAHDLGRINNRNIAINFIGDFSVNQIPTLPQVEAVIKLIERGVQDCHIHRNYVLVPHNATMATLSPGRKVYEIISEWEHFQPTLGGQEARNFGMDTACKSPKETTDEPLGVSASSKAPREAPKVLVDAVSTSILEEKENDGNAKSNGTVNS